MDYRIPVVCGYRTGDGVVVGAALEAGEDGLVQLVPEVVHLLLALRVRRSDS